MIAEVSLEKVKYLFENYGTRVDDDTWSKILYLACGEGMSSVVEYLLQRKGNKEITKYFYSDRSPLRTACYYGHTAVVQILVKYNVDIRKEKELECGNDEIISILNMELKKSLKHREKIQILQQIEEKRASEGKIVLIILKACLNFPNFDTTIIVVIYTQL